MNQMKEHKEIQECSNNLFILKQVKKKLYLLSFQGLVREHRADLWG